MQKVTITPTDELMKRLQEERKARKRQTIPETIIVMLEEYFAMIRKTVKTQTKTPKKSIFQNARENRVIHFLLVAIYIIIAFSVLVNVLNWQIPIFKVNYAQVNSPTDYKFVQTYPPSVQGIRVGNANETLIFDVHMHADTIIAENTPVQIEVNGGAGNLLAENTTDIDVGFFDAQYVETPILNNEGYVLWSGFAGVTLDKSIPAKPFPLFVPAGGVELGSESRNIFWTTSGDKQLSICINWLYAPAGFVTYTYEYSTVHVYSYDDLRTRQFTFIGGFAVFEGLLFGVFEVYPSIRGNKERARGV